MLALAATRRLRDLVSGPLGDLIVKSFRVVPRQDRSMESVERMLAAVERLARRARDVDELTMEAVALEAHVTPQAGYRYFRDVDDLLRLLVRRVQTVELERLMAALVERPFESLMDMAETAVSFVVDTLRGLAAIPARLRDRIALDYSSLGYGLVWTLSELVCAALSSRGGPCAGIGVVPLNGALVSVISVATSFAVRDGRLVAESHSQAMMMNIFLAAVGDPGSTLF